MPAANADDPGLVFTDSGGNPICFYIHPSVREPHKIENLTRDIEENGGRVLDTDEGVDTVITNTNRAEEHALQLTYGCSSRAGRRTVWVEPPQWIRSCINLGMCVHTVPQRKGMGGSINKNIFTPEEVENLCQYVARRIPDAAAGGRRGEGVYIELAMMGRASEEGDEFYWANRHPWQSWRNKMNKNFESLNARVDEIASRLEPSQTHLYHLDRRLNRRTRKLDLSDDDEEEEEPESEEASDGGLSDRALRKRRYKIEQARKAFKIRGNASSKSRRKVSRKDTNAMVFGEESEQEIPRSKKRFRDGSPLFNEEEQGVGTGSPLFSEVDEDQVAHPFEGVKHQMFLAEDDEHEPIFGDDFEPLILEPGPPYQHSIHSEEELPPPSQTFGLSQKTLVDHPISTRKRIPSSISRRRGELQRSPLSSADQPGPSQPSARRRESNVTPSRLAGPSTSQLSPIRPPIAAQPISPARLELAKRQGAAIKTASRKGKPPSAPVLDAPSRNTRARSRATSVEPVAAPPPKRRKKRPRLDTVDERPTLIAPADEPLPEEYHADVEEPLPPIETIQAETVASTATTTRADELEDVQDQLMIISHTSVQEEARAKSMDSDDAQTDVALRRTVPLDEEGSQLPESFFEAVDNILERFEASLTNTMNPMRTSTRSLRIPQPLFQSSAPNSLRGTTFTVSPPASKMKTTTPRRRSSNSSVEAFPLPGTRASAIKEKIQENEKSTPYKPPAGTKAARFRERDEQNQNTQQRALRLYRADDPMNR